MEIVWQFVAAAIGALVVQMPAMLYESHKSASGYFIKTLRRAFWPVAWVSLLEICIAFAIALLMKKEGLTAVSWAFCLGLFAATVPQGAQALFISLITRKNSKKPLIKALKLVRWKYGVVRSTTTELIQQDILDCLALQADWEACCDDVAKMRRRIRLLFAHLRRPIAKKNKDKRMLRGTVPEYPGDTFYYLVGYLGRKQLKARLSRDVPRVPPENSWDGSERRRVAGSPDDRVGPDSGHRRMGDELD